MLVLYTKDGRKRSNAILYGGADSKFAMLHDVKDPNDIYLVESDFGNKMQFTWAELIDQYHIGPVRSYEDWRTQRQEAIERKPNNLPFDPLAGYHYAP